MTEIVEHNGEKYHRIDPNDIDLSQMTPVKKVTGVWALQLKSGEEMQVETKSGGNVETVNTAREGDWLIYNIGNSFGNTLEEKIKNSDVKVISDEAFKKLYRVKKTEDESDYSDYEDTLQGAEYEYSGKEIYAARVPFNFFIRAPWGADQFIKKGGYLIYNTNTSTSEKKDIYGTAGMLHGIAGQMENTYALASDLSKLGVAEQQKQVNDKKMRDLYHHVLAADRSPIAGIQFNSVDLQRAYERLGIETKKWEHKFSR